MLFCPCSSCLQNSSLVLTSSTRTRDAHEPSGEPESLWGKMKGKMGDRVQFGRPDSEKEERAKKKKEAAKKKRGQGVRKACFFCYSNSDSTAQGKTEAWAIRRPPSGLGQGAA